MEKFDLNHCIKILQYWHKVEFFQSFDLQEKFDNKKITYKLYSNELKDERLPWFNPEAERMAGGKSGKTYRYQLYLGIFDKSVIKPMAESYFRGPQDENEAIDWQEREELEGSTCFASLAVDSTGIPLIEDISLSTLPWAMGHLKARRLNELTYQSYGFSVNRLFEAFNRVFPYLAADSELQADPLTGQAIQSVLQALCVWAGFTPTDEQPIVAIQLFEVKPSKGKQSDKALESCKAVKNLLPDKTSTLSHVVDDDEDIAVVDSTTINILNSFFIQDIELAIAALKKGEKPEALLRYLSGEIIQRQDLYSQENELDILHRLKPAFCNQGRWPANNEHLMSLMQQYAINRGFDVLSDSGLFSVNGPPGTGKTTMLRDMVADLMVKRALVLSQMSDSKAAFNGKRTVTFSNGDTATIGLLKPELTGYEILVASANNAAVENISKELPLASELGEEYQNASYLKTVADKQLAEHGWDMKVQPLGKDKSAWGLMAVALGKKANREKFISRSLTNSNGNNKYVIPQGLDYKTLWQWRDTYTGLTFQQARQQFKTDFVSFEDENKKYSEFIKLWELLSTTDREQYCAEEIHAVEEAELTLAALKENAQNLRRDFISKQRQLERLTQEMQAHQALKPGWWVLFFHYRQWREYYAQRREYGQQHFQLRRDVNRLETKLESTLLEVERQQKSVADTVSHLQIKQHAYDQLDNDYSALKTYFNCPLSIEIPLNLQDKATQRAALFQNPRLNAARSRIFISAMTLHEAWLAETLKKGGKFGGNLLGISKLLSGNRVTSSDDILSLWQSLFMIVPVISSTFASIARQFNGVDMGEFGWLFIDEAGQAIPQQAVGAMLRCKRVMVVGDPLQIEPVFTTPFALVEGLAKMDFGDDFARWSPSVTSIQKIADEANPYGTYLTVAEKEQWIGSPLRVHRRCNDPMFSISNRIAYEDTMVHAVDDPNDDTDYLLGSSGWLHLTGQVEGRQFVQAQALAVAKIVEHMILQNSALPNIYIITPFREIKDKLKSILKSKTSLQLHGEQQRKFEHWVNKRVGTVHTFQGKEEEAVILVLGTDKNRSGSAAWAASKPNLLNVAVTRAKRRIYIIGDKQLWGGFPYFNEAARQLDELMLDDLIQSE